LPSILLCTFLDDKKILMIVALTLVKQVFGCASTLSIVFQLSCSILISLVLRFTVGLKAKIGVFFPMKLLHFHFIRMQILFKVSVLFNSFGTSLTSIVPIAEYILSQD